MKPFLYNRALSAFGIVLLFFLLVYFFFGFIYELYEGLFTATFAEVLTPGYLYDHHYYMAHIGLWGKFYAFINSYIPGVPVLAYAQYLYLLVGVSVIVYVLLRRCNKYIFLLILLALLVLLEHIHTLQFSRVSIILCAAGGLLLFEASIKKIKLNSFKPVLIILLWVTGLYVRVETALFCLAIIVPAFLLLRLWKQNHSSGFLYLFLIVFPSLILSLYIVFAVKSSDKFYLQIEPNYEYEIMEKKNIIDISSMKSERDSLRYEAIKEGFWGDADINPASFIQSLIGEREGGVYWKGKAEYQRLLQLYINDYRYHLWVYLFVCVFALGAVGMKSKRYLYSLFLYQIYGLLLLIFIAIQLKYTDRVNTSMLGMLIVIQIYFLARFENTRFKALTYILLICLPMYLLMDYNLGILDVKRHELDSHRRVAKIINDKLKGRTLIVNNEIITVLTNQFRPLENMELTMYRRVFMHDMLAYNTMSPYKEYLEKELGCEVENYGSLYRGYYEFDSNAVYVMHPQRKDFLENYLYKIHGIKMNWQEMNFSGEPLGEYISSRKSFVETRFYVSRADF